ncbi:hypothetical protein DFH07DRAFT_778491 [Mycena maculata]|uniref:Uncharacterized protein n=1 Tax=Mycena maculata TaxID=230809 RepID=A0AAD7N0C8_9AGAR|nr:hypothetical protein DFH07DRAFT_778491 [Mycena maculata]
MSPLLLLSPKDLPILESIEIYAFVDTWNYNRRVIGATIFQIPSLRRVSFEFDTDITTPALPRWSQLIELNLLWGVLELDRTVELLDRCSQLVRCCLNVAGIITPIHPRTISLPKLHALVLKRVHGFTGCLDMLALRYLEFAGDEPRFDGWFTVTGRPSDLTLNFSEQISGWKDALWDFEPPSWCYDLTIHIQI